VECGLIDAKISEPDPETSSKLGGSTGRGVGGGGTTINGCTMEYRGVSMLGARPDGVLESNNWN